MLLAGTASDGLVFVRRTESGADLWRARVADGAVAPLRGTSDAEEVWPYWSPAAGLLVFQSRPAGSDAGYRLVLLDPATDELRPLTEPPDRNEHWPVWSPAGDRVAYTFAGRATGGVAGGAAWVDVASGEARVAAPGSDAVTYFRPEFDPSGRRIVAQRGAFGRDSTLWILEEGRPPRALTGDERWFEQKGRFTRDGEWIVYTRRSRHGMPGDLVLIRPDGSGARVVASRLRSDDHTARASPTRDELAFISNRARNSELYVVDLFGGRPRRLTRTPNQAENAPRWSPDGQRIAVTVELPDGRFHVAVVDREGRTLLDVPGMMPDWMPPWP